ncbi:hypothetical protein QFZ64_001286 [Streptomyces sp. B3I8]|nr:hypothetical protein [Streptomyces sp. B3I8]
MRGITRPSAPPGRVRTARVARVHRTTTAALLVTVTASALAGCTTVQRPVAPGPPPSPPPSRTTAARPDGSDGPRLVQAPADEALERTGPRAPSAGTPGHPVTPSHGPVPPAPHRAPAPPAAPHRHRDAPPAGHRAAPPPAAVPKLPADRSDVCALGRTYGQWPAGSPQSRICDDTYGH